MPYYSYRCSGCGTEFETLVRSSDTPACLQCGSEALERLLGVTAPAARTPGLLGSVRAQAAREGHFSNYSRKELKGKS
jgi:putative FmdB family regulatory protein